MLQPPQVSQPLAGQEDYTFRLGSVEPLDFEERVVSVGHAGGRTVTGVQRVVGEVAVGTAVEDLDLTELPDRLLGLLDEARDYRVSRRQVLAIPARTLDSDRKRDWARGPRAGACGAAAGSARIGRECVVAVG